MHLIRAGHALVAGFALLLVSKGQDSQIVLDGNIHSNTHSSPEAPGLEAWMDQQRRISLEKLLSNISPGGDHDDEIVPGTVLASPSKNHPDYFYQWIRDAGITLSTIVDLYARNGTSVQLRARIEYIMDAFIKLSVDIQHRSNPSGSFSDLSGLGEPKFNADGTPFVGNWGRPQRDGPALRAIALISYLRAYNASHPDLWQSRPAAAYSTLYSAALPPKSVIKADLEYVARYWADDGFDIWEEVSGKHFFTAMVQQKALRGGAELAIAFGDVGAADWYRKQAAAIGELLRQFWIDDKGHLVATLDGHRSGLDCSLALGALHGRTAHDPEFEHIMTPESDETLVSLFYLILDQRDRFPINQAEHKAHGRNLTGAGIGRYPEDVYDGYENSERGGNPWFICTATTAEVLYRTAIKLRKQASLAISSRGLPFWRAVLPDSNFRVGDIFNTSSPILEEAIASLIWAGDSFLNVIKVHAAADGSLSEQFDRDTGFERGARDLTWSYGSLLQAFWSRDQLHTRDVS